MKDAYRVFGMNSCVCVCEREREKRKERGKEGKSDRRPTLLIL